MAQTIGKHGIQAEMPTKKNKEFNGRSGIQTEVPTNKNEEIKGEVTMKRNNSGLEFEVIGEKVKNGRTYCLVLFTESGSVRWARKDHVSEGSVKDLHHLSVCGIGGSGVLSHNGDPMSIDTAFDPFEKEQAEKAHATIEKLWKIEPEDWISTIISDSLIEAEERGLTDQATHELTDVSPEVAELLKKEKGILQEKAILQISSLVENFAFLLIGSDTKIFVYDVPGQAQRMKDLKLVTDQLFSTIEEIFKQMIEAHEEQSISKAAELLREYNILAWGLIPMLLSFCTWEMVESELLDRLDDLLEESKVC